MEQHKPQYNKKSVEVNNLIYKPISRGLELDLESLEGIVNPNVRSVAIAASDIRKKLEKDPFYKIHGAYSEAYQGERA